jgi:hypothetical protein
MACSSCSSAELWQHEGPVSFVRRASSDDSPSLLLSEGNGHVDELGVLGILHRGKDERRVGGSICRAGQWALRLASISLTLGLECADALEVSRVCDNGGDGLEEI